MSYVLKTIAAKVIEGVVLLLVIAFIGYNLKFLGLDENLLNAMVSLWGVDIGVIFVSSVGGFTLNAAHESGGVFSRMSNFRIGALISFVNIVLYLIIASFVMPMIFPNNFVTAPLQGMSYWFWLCGFAVNWYLIVVVRLWAVADFL